MVLELQGEQGESGIKGDKGDTGLPGKNVSRSSTSVYRYYYNRPIFYTYYNQMVRNTVCLNETDKNKI